ncbi:MAG: DMT family transporter [Bacteroidales bacterium]|nr:DMT family transporter [Bacteroidales bacterium]
MNKRPFYLHSVFLALFACLLWSTAFAAIKIGLRYTTPLQFAGIRFILSGLMILPFTGNLKENWAKTKKNWKAVFLISLFQTIILYTFFYLGMNKTPAAIGAIIVGAGPLFVALLAHFITGRDPLTLRKSIALMIGFSGIILLAMSKDQGETNHLRVVTGILLLITGNFAGSFGNILVSRNKTGIAPVFLSAVQILFGGLVILVISLFFEDINFTVKPLPYYISLGWLSFLSAAAFSLWFVVLSRPEVRVSDINVWKFIIPVVGAVLSWILIAGEKPQWNTLAGMTLIASSILIIYFRGIYAYFSRSSS